MNKLNHEQLLNGSLQVYESTGQDGVFNWVTRVASKLNWYLCSPCETLSPFSQDSCLVCWSVKQMTEWAATPELDISFQHCGKPAYWDNGEVYCSKCQEIKGENNDDQELG